MTDALLDVIHESQWSTRLIAELGSPANLFFHMIRVRDVYRDALETGILSFPGRFLPDNAHVATELRRSREQLAQRLAGACDESVKFGLNRLSADEICAAAIQHEGLHQGQWYVALKQQGIPLPISWRQDWSLT
ncbi:DinB family protein [Sulfobacillus harzensis]|uniref:DinB family protein n=1 Tax=Sulfobacillus harzensis TaxID=2729629 RepID=UPI003B831623